MRNLRRILATICAVYLPFSPAVAQENDHPIKILFQEAAEAYNTGDYQRCIDLQEKSLEIYEPFAPSHFYLGMCHKELGSPLKEVAPHFERAIEIDPRYALAYDHLGKIYYAMEDFDRAEEVTLRAHELDPSSVSAKLSLGWIYLLGKSTPSEAVHYFEQVLEDTDNISYGYFGLGMAYFMNGEKHKTLEMITELKQMDEETLAEELEKMIRGKKFIQPERGQPLISSSQKREKGTLVKNLPALGPDPSSAQNSKVRIKDPSPQISPPTTNNSPAGLSGRDRIRELQRNSQRKGSGY